MSLDTSWSVGCNYLCRTFLDSLAVLCVSFLIQSGGMVIHRLIRYHIRILNIIYSLDSGNCC